MTASTLPAPEAAAEATGGGACRHCGDPLGERPLSARIAGREVRVCGDDCLTAVATIADAGLDAWYRLRAHRDASGSVTGDPGFRAEVDAWRLPEVAAGCVRPARGGADEITLTVEGMRCAGCAWLVEGLLGKARGVRSATVDFPLRRAVVRFDPRVTGVHRLLEALARAGYRASPYSPHGEEAAIESERRARIRGLGISAAFGMQVMLLSIALYASDHYGGMDPGLEQLFRWLAMVLTVPVLAWPGRAFFTGALAALRGQHLTMDVPVALGLSIAFLGSAFATVSGDGEIWFDSVVMFVTLLGGARYLELVARRRSTATVRALARAAPLVATRVRRAEGEEEDEDGRAGAGGETIDERVPAAALRPGDRVRVRPRRDRSRRRRHPFRRLRLRRVAAYRRIGARCPIGRGAGARRQRQRRRGGRGRGRRGGRRHGARRGAPARGGGRPANGPRWPCLRTGSRPGSSAGSSCSRPGSRPRGCCTTPPGRSRWWSRSSW